MIRIFSENAQDAAAISEIFYYLGILAQASDYHTEDIHCDYKSVLLLPPYSDEHVSALLHNMRNAMPVFAIERKLSCSTAEIFRNAGVIMLPDSCPPPMLPQLIASAQRSSGARYVIGDYYASGVRASNEWSYAISGKYKIPLTRTELMIVRYLCAVYPERKGSSDIMKNAFREGRSTELSNIRTHISMINKKSERISGDPLISSVPREGYCIFA
jgi:DNA-binding response OmpR family regulator